MFNEFSATGMVSTFTRSFPPTGRVPCPLVKATISLQSMFLDTAVGKKRLDEPRLCYAVLARAVLPDAEESVPCTARGVLCHHELGHTLNRLQIGV